MAIQTVKHDNRSWAAKISLRRYFLRKYHADGSAEVLDCCQGTGFIWKRLREEFRVKSYWGVDIKPKPGRMQIASEHLLAVPRLPQDVIDIDTYGSPWSHWTALVANIWKPITVFLTVGGRKNSNSPCPMSADARKATGVTFDTRALGGKSLEIKLGGKIRADFVMPAMLARVDLIESKEMTNDTGTRYLGLRIAGKTK